MMHGLDVKHSVGRKIAHEDSAFDLRLDDAAVYFVRQIGVRVEDAYDRTLGYRVLPAGNKAPSVQGARRKVSTFRRTNLRTGCGDCVRADTACPECSRRGPFSKAKLKAVWAKLERPRTCKGLHRSD